MKQEAKKYGRKTVQQKRGKAQGLKDRKIELRQGKEIEKSCKREKGTKTIPRLEKKSLQRRKSKSEKDKCTENNC